MSIVLTADQQAAYAELVSLVTTDKTEVCINGFAGTGKTTLVNTFLAEWDNICKLSGGAFKRREIHLTATTNKAADALSVATGRKATTIHKLLGLRIVNEGYNKTRIEDTGKILEKDSIIVIDEASFIDDELLEIIREKTKHSKVIYLGDPCQLKPVGSNTTPVFSSNIPEVTLTQIVRQSDTSPIQALSRGLRNHVAGDPMPKAGVDGSTIMHMNQADFEQYLVNACRMGVGNSVRALTWTNKAAIYYNNLVAQHLSGNADFKKGDTVVVNKQVAYLQQYRFTTDSTVYIEDLGDWEIDKYGITSRLVTTKGGITMRHAKDQSDLIGPLKQAYANQDLDMQHLLENYYVDLRLMYASTVNKAQGSTYEIVFIDLDDIGKCRDRDQVRRMLYVAVSRARTRVVFKGDV